MTLPKKQKKRRKTNPNGTTATNGGADAVEPGLPHGNIGQGESLERTLTRQAEAPQQMLHASTTHGRMAAPASPEVGGMEFTSGRRAAAQDGRLVSENAAVPHVWQLWRGANTMAPLTGVARQLLIRCMCVMRRPERTRSGVAQKRAVTPLRHAMRILS